MNKIVIIGSSVAGVKAAELIREKDAESAITILCYDEYYPYSRDSFFEKIAKNDFESDGSYQNKEFFKKKNIEVVLDKKITRINFQRKKIFTEDKFQIEYDFLLIGEVPKNIYPQVKGTNREGVYSFSKWMDVKRLSDLLPLIDSVIIQSNKAAGIQLALAIMQRGKEVLIVSPEKNILAEVLDGDYYDFVMSLLEDKGIRFIDGNKIIEVLGDSSVKAVRLKSEKVIACQNIIFVDAAPDLRLFQDLMTEEENTLSVDANFQTKIEGVFILDGLAKISEGDWNDIEWHSSNLEEQGKVVAALIAGAPEVFSPCSLPFSFQTQGLAVSLLGEPRQGFFSEQYSQIDRENKTCKAIFVSDKQIIGALLINREEEKEELSGAILAKTILPKEADLVVKNSETTI